MPLDMIGHHVQRDVGIKHVAADWARLFLVGLAHVCLVVENRRYTQRTDVRIYDAVRIDEWEGRRAGRWKRTGDGRPKTSKRKIDDTRLVILLFG